MDRPCLQGEVRRRSLWASAQHRSLNHGESPRATVVAKPYLLLHTRLMRVCDQQLRRKTDAMLSKRFIMASAPYRLEPAPSIDIPTRGVPLQRTAMG